MRHGRLGIIDAHYRGIADAHAGRPETPPYRHAAAVAAYRRAYAAEMARCPSAAPEAEPKGERSEFTHPR